MEVKFHDIGEGMNEGEIVNYLVKVGDDVTVDQPLVEMQTDKMVAEIPSPTAGRIEKIYFEAGETITVGTVIMSIDNGQEQTDFNEPITEAVQKKRIKSKETIPVQQHRHQRILAAPYTRKIARDHEIDIEQINGTGAAGRVTDKDVYLFMNKPPVHDGAFMQVNSLVDSGIAQEDTIPFKGIRKQIANKMSHSLQTIPHVTHYEEVDVTKLLELREELKKTGDRISIVAFFIKAAAIALKDYHVFNARLDEANDVIRLAKNYNIGLATDTEAGLMVPVLQAVEEKSLREIHAEMKALTKKAQDGKLTGQDMKNGTFTISNAGPLGGVGATPIINHPETGILAFHKTKKMPVVMENEEIAIRSIMNLSFSFDHRVADGALAVAFTNRFAALIGEPAKLILELV